MSVRTILLDGDASNLPKPVDAVEGENRLSWRRDDIAHLEETAHASGHLDTAQVGFHKARRIEVLPTANQFTEHGAHVIGSLRPPARMAHLARQCKASDVEPSPRGDREIDPGLARREVPDANKLLDRIAAHVGDFFFYETVSHVGSPDHAQSCNIQGHCRMLERLGDAASGCPIDEVSAADDVQIPGSPQNVPGQAALDQGVETDSGLTGTRPWVGL